MSRRNALLLSCLVVGRETTRIGSIRATSNEGAWGSWSQSFMCPHGQRVTGFQVREESWQGLGDDTGMNGFRARCAGGQTLSADGYWGDWTGESPSCPVGFSGFKQKVEHSQGFGDDTALNDVAMWCETGYELSGSKNRGWGEWSGYESCTGARYVCGFQIKTESQQGTGDDTSANGMIMECCQDCAIGQYQLEDAFEACTACPPGTFGSAVGEVSLSSCASCPFGYYQAVGGAYSKCEACTHGTDASSCPNPTNQPTEKRSLRPTQPHTGPLTSTHTHGRGDGSANECANRWAGRTAPQQ
jgi:hypothetical protein